MIDFLHNLFWELRRLLWNRRQGKPGPEGLNIFVDDERECNRSGFYHAKSAEEALGLLLTQKVANLALDHDLGSGMNGYQLVLYLAERSEDEYFPRNYWPKNEPTIHTDNPVGRENMQAVIDRYGPYPKKPHLRSVQ